MFAICRGNFYRLFVLTLTGEYNNQGLHLRFGNKKAHFGIVIIRITRFYAFLTNKIYQSKRRMDINRIERRVKKINAVLEAFKEDNRISAIEKDLLLGYVRELYDLIRESDADSFDVTTATPSPEVKSAPEVTTVAIKPEVVKPVETPIHQPVAPKEEVVIEVQAAPLPKKEEVVVEVPKAAEPPQPQPTATPKNHYSEELEAIFKMDEITDLSAKLSMSKIDDISKAIGINERIFTINELFGGNGNLFTSIINQLNACQDFDQAKALLIAEVAIPQQWEKEDKVRKAQQFVKHVRRKFN